MKDEEKNNLVSIDSAKIKRLKERGHIGSMLEEFELLRLKLLYEEPMNKQEASKLVTLTKYFMDNGPSEAFRLSCKFLYEKYIKPYNL
jgi:hypothetical protein